MRVRFVIAPITKHNFKEDEAGQGSPSFLSFHHTVSEQFFALKEIATKLAEFHTKCSTLVVLQNKAGSPSKAVGSSDDLLALTFLPVVRLPGLVPLGDSLDDPIYLEKLWQWIRSLKSLLSFATYRDIGLSMLECWR